MRDVTGQKVVASLFLMGLMPPVTEAGPVASHEVTSTDEADSVELYGDQLPRGFEWEMEGLLVVDQEIGDMDVGAPLKLRRVPRVVLRDASEVCIDDWGIKIAPVVEAAPDRIAKDVERRFRALYRKAQQQALTSDERRMWRNMLADLDSDAYVESCSPAVFTIGVIKSINPKYAIVQWSDDPEENERVDGEMLKAISFLRDGDVFSASAKFVAKRLVGLDNVMPCDV